MNRFNLSFLSASIVSVAMGLSSAQPAAAQAGVREINQICATQTGCFPGDDPGYPVSVTQSGSYRLTSNLSRLTNGSMNSSMIEVSAPDVELDLGGFRIACSSFLVNTECSGSGRGVHSTESGTTVRNGTIKGMASDGLYLSGGGRVSKVSALANGGRGIWTSSASIVENCRSIENGGEGILTGSTSTVRDSVSRSNESNGLRTSGDSVIRGNTSTDNGGAGVSTGTGSTVTDNVANSNEGDGFSLTSSQIASTNGGLAKGNVAIGNGGYGFDSSLSIGGFTFSQSTWGLIDNVARRNNDEGEQIRGGVELGQNLCGVDISCP